MKKILGLALALVMVLGLTTMAWADTIVVKYGETIDISDPATFIASGDKLTVEAGGTVILPDEWTATWNPADDVANGGMLQDCENGAIFKSAISWVQVDDGIFVMGENIAVDENGKIIGGTFAEDVSNYLADGYELDANWTVSAVTGGNNPTNTPTNPPANTPTYIPAYTPVEITVSSPKTFDTGVAMYIGMSLLSAAGSAVVISKRREL